MRKKKKIIIYLPGIVPNRTFGSQNPSPIILIILRITIMLSWLFDFKI